MILFICIIAPIANLSARLQTNKKEKNKIIKNTPLTISKRMNIL